MSPRPEPWLAVLALACTAGDAPTAERPPDELPLAWYPADPEDTWAEARQGLDWALSQIGALPPADGSALHGATTRDGSVHFTLRLDRLGLGPDAHAVLDEVADELWVEGAPADVGRLLLRALHEPWRYYALTGACPSFSAWTAQNVRAPVDYAVTTSLLTDTERLIRFEPDAEPLAMAFSVQEGTGSLGDGSFAAVESEVVDLMPNGQFRYAVYDESGALVPSARHAPAGPPGRCAWCHEDHLQTGTADNASAPGYLDFPGWVAQRDAAQVRIEAFRAGLATSIAWDPAVHEAGERLVEAFLFPDAARVAAEWGTTETEVVRRLGVGTLEHEEFGWTARYTRADVDAAAPGEPPVQTLSSARELGEAEALAPAPEPGCE